MKKFNKIDVHIMIAILLSKLTNENFEYNSKRRLYISNNFTVSLASYDDDYRLQKKDNKGPRDYIGDFYIEGIINKINELNGDLK